MRTARALAATLALVYGAPSGQPTVTADQPVVGDRPVVKVSPMLLTGLHWRSIGPAMFGGRVVDVAGVPGKPDLLFVGAASSGLYKSTNGGTTFESIFNDGQTLSIGAIAVQPDNPDVIYVGTGEGFPRNSISFGDGIYKTVDGGKSWAHLGLADSERFSRVVILTTWFTF